MIEQKTAEEVPLESTSPFELRVDLSKNVSASHDLVERVCSQFHAVGLTAY